MKLIFLLATFLISPFLKAADSKIIPVFLEAAEIYVSGSKSSQLIVRPDLLRILRVLEDKKISIHSLAPYLDLAKRKLVWSLPADDEFDRWSKDVNPVAEVPEVALHAFRLDVIEESDDFFKDDIYAYFFVTDGVVPTGKVTSIYKGLKAGQSFFFNQTDRAIFPLIGLPAKSPENHLIVDYGIVESDGDDIKELQKLSAIIIDIALAVYSSYDPQTSQILIKLRKEIKALAEMLISLNDDDRLVTGSFGYKASELATVLNGASYVEFKKTHKKDSTFDSWKYDLNFRLLRK